MNKELFEQIVINDDNIHNLQNMNKEEINIFLGNYFSRMVGYEQKNSHHCYDLWNHIINTVLNIKNNNDEFKYLRIAALFHDIGKPDVVGINPNTHDQTFYGHAKESSEIAKKILHNMGYEEEEITKICFYIAHHDDFISYKNRIEKFQLNHMFIRKIDEMSVAEKIVENMFNFKAMGYDEPTMRAICYTIVYNKYPVFKVKGEFKKYEVDINDFWNKVNTGKYYNEFVPSREDYHNLLNLCMADASSQADKVITNGKLVTTKEEKLANLEMIDENIEQSFNIVDSIFNVKRNKDL